MPQALHPEVASTAFLFLPALALRISCPGNLKRKRELFLRKWLLAVAVAAIYPIHSIFQEDRFWPLRLPLEPQDRIFRFFFFPAFSLLAFLPRCISSFSLPGKDARSCLFSGKRLL